MRLTADRLGEGGESPAIYSQTQSQRRHEEVSPSETDSNRREPFGKMQGGPPCHDRGRRLSFPQSPPPSFCETSESGGLAAELHSKKPLSGVRVAAARKGEKYQNLQIRTAGPTDHRPPIPAHPTCNNSSREAHCPNAAQIVKQKAVDGRYRTDAPRPFFPLGGRRAVSSNACQPLPGFPLAAGAQPALPRKVASLSIEKASQTFTLGPTANTVRAADGKVHTAPADWLLLAPGDAALTRRVKAAGEHWVVAEKKGRRVFSRGLWAPAATIERIRAALEAERSTASFARRKAADGRRRDQAQTEYVEDFARAVVEFLAFHLNHAELAGRLARAVTDHATPVGSGTVARTKRIPIQRRAEAAVIAWMRHQTTGYDGMVIRRVKGKRREVRRMLARRSQELLARYRRADSVGEACPLKAALALAQSA